MFAYYLGEALAKSVDTDEVDSFRRFLRDHNESDLNEFQGKLEGAIKLMQLEILSRSVIADMLTPVDTIDTATQTPADEIPF